MQFGKLETTKIIDDEGSTVTQEKNYREGVSSKPVRVKYAIRHRTDKTDLETLVDIAKSLIEDPHKFDTSMVFEPSKNGNNDGYHHIVECYTLLEY